MKRKAISIIIIAVAFVLGIAAHAVWHRAFAVTHDDPAAHISLHSGGTPLVIATCVSDTSGRAVAGVVLDFVSSSGGNLCTTDATGRARVNLGETDLEEILINGKSVARWSNACLLNHPSVTKGLMVNIVIKDSSLIEETKSFQQTDPPDKQ